MDVSACNSYEQGKDENVIINLSLDKGLLYDAENPFNLPSSIFCNVFRLSKDMVRHMIDVIKVKDTTPDNSGLPIEQQVLITLLVYANGEYQQWPDTTGGNGPEVSTSVVNSVLKRITMAISNHMLQLVKFPVTPAERVDAKKAFEKCNSPFPGAFGAMDNFHVRISPPALLERQTFWSPCNRFYSLNVQLICDAATKILYVNPRFPGGCHDNVIWLASTARRNLSSAYDEGERDAWLIGDGNYAMQPWLMTPVPPSQSEPETSTERYNAAHTKALEAVHKCVRALRGTWRILSVTKPIDHDPIVAANIVNVCSVLHNMRVAANAPLIMEVPRKKPSIRKRRSETNENNLAPQVLFAGPANGGPSNGGPAAPRPALLGQSAFGVQCVNGQFAIEENLKLEAARLEIVGQVEGQHIQDNQVLQFLGPQRILSSQAAAQNILANRAVAQNSLANPACAQNLIANQAAAQFSLVKEDDEQTDENIGGRRNELYLARRIQARIIAQHFEK